tara:strand:- start:6294 stop:7202 length:909 start_codon:yes stop_codon:yes gene_type:complete
MNCPLCSAARLSILDNIRSDDIVATYRKFCGVDFSYLFPTDIKYFSCLGCDLKFFYPAVTGDEVFYNELQKIEWYYLSEKNEYIFSSGYIGKFDSVLEVGCGKGAFAKYVNKEKYVGLDFSENAVLLAKKDDVCVINEDISSFSTTHPGQFDVVVSFQVLEHVSNPDIFLESMVRSLKKEGKLIVAVPSDDSFLKHVTNGVLNMPPHHVTRWSDRSLRFVANKYDLELVKIYHERLQPIHWGWYLSELVQNSIIKNKMIDRSIARKVVSKIGSIFSKFLLRGFGEGFLPIGHTVVVVYKKIK